MRMAIVSYIGHDLRIAVANESGFTEPLGDDVFFNDEMLLPVLSTFVRVCSPKVEVGVAPFVDAGVYECPFDTTVLAFSYPFA